MENLEGWKVQIQDRPAYWEKEIIIYRKTNDGIEMLQFEVKTVTFKLGEDAPNSGFRASNDLLKELAKAMRESGFRTDRDSYNDGELKATKGHLEDMRSLVFNSNEERVEIVEREIPSPKGV